MTVIYKNNLWLLRYAFKPGKEHIFVCVAAYALHFFNICVDLHFLAEKINLIGTFNNLSAKCSLSLISYE